MTRYNSKIFASLEQSLLRSDAFGELKPTSQIAVLFLDLVYWEGARRNPIRISQKSLAEWINRSPKTAQTVLTELDDYGFLVRERAGSLKGAVSDRAAIYRLTWHHDNSGIRPTRDYKKFKSEQGKNDDNTQ